MRAAFGLLVAELCWDSFPGCLPGLLVVGWALWGQPGPLAAKLTGAPVRSRAGVARDAAAATLPCSFFSSVLQAASTPDDVRPPTGRAGAVGRGDES